MRKALVALPLLAVWATPVAAQLNLPAELNFDFTLDQPDPVLTDPPADKEMPKASEIAENLDLSSIYTTTSLSMRPVTGAPDQAKVRFTCGESTTVKFVDQLRGAHKQPFSHLHDFFGGRTVTKDAVHYTDLRRAAKQLKAGAIQASNCPGDWAQNSLYWRPALLETDALGDGITRAKKHNLVTLYYYCDQIGDCKRSERFRPEFGGLFGQQMDDPTWSAYRARIDANNARNPTRTVTFVKPTPHWTCEGYGEADNLEDEPIKSCPASALLMMAVVSNTCWNGHLRAPDGYSNTLPAARSQDGRLRCPREYGYRLATIETIFRFSHRGPADIAKMYLSSDAHMAAALGAPVKRGASPHTDYIFGHSPQIADDWQCALSIPVPGRTCTQPYDMDYSTIGFDKNGVAHRLLSDAVVPNSGGKLLVDLSVNHTGASPDDWLPIPGMTPPPPPKGALPIHVH